MRTLKKSLCLVLVLVMMLGLCVINVGATSYTDDEDIAQDYRQALEVLTGIGVFNGKDDGSMGPQDALTRVEGCYLICKMLITPNGAGFASFSDVSAQDSPIVAYCQTLDITNGYGDNTFHPYDPLTGAAFAKWLLVALGYNATAENMTGVNWIGPTNQLTSSVGLSKGIPGYDPTETLTREQAAQMCLNALQATMVEYQTNLTVVTEDTDLMIHGARNNLPNLTNTDYRTSVQASPTAAGNSGAYTTMQFVERYFPTLKLEDATRDPGTTPKADELYHPVEKTWMYRTVELYRVLDTPIYCYSSKIKANAIATDLAGYYIYSSGGTNADNRMYVNDITKYDVTTSQDGKNMTANIITVNGAEPGNTGLNTNNKIIVASSVGGTGIAGDYQGNGLVFIGAGSSAPANSVTLADAIAKLTENGREVAIYANNVNEPYQITDIVVTCYTVGKVRDVTTSGGTTNYTFTAADANTTITISGNTRSTYDSVPTDNTLITNDTLAKDDIITFTWPAGQDITKTTSGTNAKMFAYATEAMTGVQTLWSSSNTAVIDGVTYDVATGVAKDNKYSTKLKAEDDFNVNGPTDGEFFLDQFGYLVHSDTVENSNFAFIVAAYASDNAGLNGSSPTVWVRAVLSDGTVGDYKVATVRDYTSFAEYWPTVDTTTAKLDKSYVHVDGNVVRGPDSNPAKVWLIKNTGILVDTNSTIDGKEWYNTDNASTTNTHLTVNNAAQILMSDAYGYVYNYKLDGDTIELIPATHTGYDLYTEIHTSAESQPNKWKQNQTVSGQTLLQLMKSRQNYANASAAAGTNKKNWAEPGNKSFTYSAGSNAHSLLINSTTTVVSYDLDTQTARVYSGVSNMPSPEKATNTLYGYYVGSPVADGSSSLAAKIVFVANDGSYTTTTKHYAYVTGDYEVVRENGVDVTYHDAYLSGNNGQKTLVRLANKSNFSDPGLYEIDADNVVDGGILTDSTSTSAYVIDADNPYAYVGKATPPAENVVNGLIYAGDGTDGNSKNRADWIVGSAEIVSIKGGNYLSDNLIIVLEVVDDSLTGFIKTIYALG